MVPSDNDDRVPIGNAHGPTKRLWQISSGAAASASAHALGAFAVATARSLCPQRLSSSIRLGGSSGWHLFLITQACHLDFFGWLIVSTLRGCACQHLFHGLGLDKTFDSSVNHRVDALVHCEFIVNDVRRVNLCGSVQ
jgi:hypothetical protein